MQATASQLSHLLLWYACTLLDCALWYAVKCIHLKVRALEGLVICCTGWNKQMYISERMTSIAEIEQYIVITIVIS